MPTGQISKSFPDWPCRHDESQQRETQIENERGRQIEREREVPIITKITMEKLLNSAKTSNLKLAMLTNADWVN